MTDAERAFALEQLRAGEQALWDALDGLSDDAARRKPAPGKWSPLECIEHVMMTEMAMQTLIAAATPGPPSPRTGPEWDTYVIAAMQSRAKKYDAPGVALPTGRFTRLADAKAAFDQVRARSRSLAETSRDNLREKWLTHPVVGKIDAYTCLLMIAMHPARHALQIRESF